MPNLANNTNRVMKIALSTPGEHEKYWISQPLEIEHILRELRRLDSPVSIYAEPGGASALSRVIDVDGNTRTFLLDYGPDAAINEHIVQSRSLTLVTNHEGIQIQFSIPKPLKVGYQGRHAWRIPLPDRLLRLQRRESYRLCTSLAHPIRCQIPTTTGLLETTLLDISLGGVAILAYEGGRLLEAGLVIQGCRIALPDEVGELGCNLRIVNTFDIRLRNGRLSHRAGCEFVNLPASAETQIQRFILRTERERRSRYI